MVSGCGAPEANENIKKLVKESIETCKGFEDFHESLANFDLANANFNTN